MTTRAYRSSSNGASRCVIAAFIVLLGGRGGPNARAFAQMANDPRVRRLLAAEGLAIDATTWFIGAQRNTCNNEVTFFDEDLLAPSCRPLFERAVDAIETNEAS